MKKLLTSIAALVLIYNASAQTCTRNVAAFSGAGGEKVSGMATLTNTNNVLTLSLAQNFSSDAGPDLHVYLAKNYAAPTTAGNTNVLLGVLKSLTGAQSYVIPSDVKISDYDQVLIHCVTYNHFYGGGALGAITGTCPTVAGIEDLGIPTSSFYFNSDLKKIVLEETNASLLVYDVLGNQLLVNNSDLTSLRSGIYFAKMINGTEAIKTLKFIIE